MAAPPSAVCRAGASGLADSAGTSTSIYGNFGEVTSETNGAGSTVTYGYNADGREHQLPINYPLTSSATWAASHAVTFSYDKADYLSARHSPSGRGRFRLLARLPHGDCWEQWELHTRYGNRILDLYDPFFEWMHEVKTGYQSSAALQMQCGRITGF